MKAFLLLSILFFFTNSFLLNEQEFKYLQRNSPLYINIKVGETVYILGNCNMGEGYFTSFKSMNHSEYVDFSGSSDKIEHLNNTQYCRFTVTGKSKGRVEMSFKGQYEAFDIWVMYANISVE